jgi:hypothetical protein
MPMTVSTDVYAILREERYQAVPASEMREQYDDDAEFHAYLERAGSIH